MLKELIPLSAKPPLFATGTANFWDDPHISKHLLAAHLEPAHDAASRRPETIDRTIEWINSSFLKPASTILDLGCGPGLYAERLAQLGHAVTGVDFSKRSIEYARSSASSKGLRISYHYQNYLKLNFTEKFDVATLIWCDFGALTDTARDMLLSKVYHALKPGGVFIFDVFSEGFAATIKEGQTWEITDNGFWAKGAYLALEHIFHYAEDKVKLTQAIVLRDDGSHDVYRIYDRYYSEEDLSRVLEAASFKEHNYFYDIVEQSQDVRFVVTRKP